LNLNDSQREAVLRKDGPLLALAGPGSGKTTVVTRRLFHLLESGAPPERILAVTFSKAAAAEMRRRVEEMARESGFPGAEALKNERRALPVNIHTFHALFFRILSARFGFSSDDIMTERETDEVFRKMLSEAGLSAKARSFDDFRREMSFVKNDLSRLADYYAVSESAAPFARVFAHYEAYKKSAGKIDFDDMNLKCFELFRAEPETLALWRGKFSYIMADEFQDISRAQYEIIKTLAAPENNLFAVGDDDQSIYAFRGASPRFLLDFEKDFPGARRVVLSVNYRSTDSLIDFARSVISRNADRFPKEITGVSGSGEPPLIIRPENPSEERALIARIINEARRAGLPFSEMAVLYRVNTQAHPILKALSEAGVPCRVEGGFSSLYDSFIASDLAAFMKFAHLRDEPSAARVINKPDRRVGNRYVSAALRHGEERGFIKNLLADPTMEGWRKRKIYEFLELCRALSKIKNAKKAFEYIRRTMDYEKHLAEYSAYKGADLDELIDILNELYDDCSDNLTVREYIERLENAELPPPDKGGVLLTTMHGAKGLEFDTVFICSAIDKILPHRLAKIEEERRLLYVAITRAKKRIIITAPKTRHGEPANISPIFKGMENYNAHKNP
jgi:DNA helicase-2/ATP-dependent DNA helicase PcrA